LKKSKRKRRNSGFPIEIYWYIRHSTEGDEKEVNGMGRKVIPFQKPNSTSIISETIDQELVRPKASGETTRSQLADYLKEEAERVRTMALLLEVAETICREEGNDGSKQSSP